MAIVPDQESVPSSLCLIGSCTTHTILMEGAYFTTLRPLPSNHLITTITDTVTGHAAGMGSALLFLPNGTRITCHNALYSPNASRNLLSYRDLLRNGFDVCTSHYNNSDVLALVQHNKTVGIFPILENGLYSTSVRTAQCTLPDSTHRSASLSFSTITSSSDQLWHKRLGHPGTTILRRIHDHKTVLGLPAPTAH